MVLSALIAVVVIVGSIIYMVNGQAVRIEDARAEQWTARAQAESARSYAQVEIARAHEAGATERAQVFALTLRSFTADNHLELTLVSVGVVLLAILQVVQILTRHGGGGHE
jgi:hypothetical protein